MFKKFSDWFAKLRPMAASLILYPQKTKITPENEFIPRSNPNHRPLQRAVTLTLKEALAIASIVDFHNNKSNMTLHIAEVLARHAVKKIYKQISNQEVRITDEDIKGLSDNP